MSQERPKSKPSVELIRNRVSCIQRSGKSVVLRSTMVDVWLTEDDVKKIVEFAKTDKLHHNVAGCVCNEDSDTAR